MQHATEAQIGIAIHILQNQEIAVLEPHVQTDSIFQEQHATDALLMPVVMV